MSNVIDERVVSMKFDNKNFEANVSTTLSTLDKLKQSLKFDGATKGLDDISSAAGRIDFSKFEFAASQAGFHVQDVFQKVTNFLENNIANKIVSISENLVKSVTIDPITSGWSKYEQKTANVQTLLNSTGKSIEEVNGYLERLMSFSDETSYSFTEMTAALSQMTSSGGDIDKLMPMITGIANATAFAGKGSTEFQSTIRNLAQSYQAGYLQLQDMKSLNLMGTSSKQLKETFISVAESLGKIKKGSVTLENFDTTLKKKWADTEVMEIALGKFSEFSEAVLDAVDSGKYQTASEAIEAMADDYDELSVKAFKSAQEAKTFQEAIDATKDAVSSGWLQIFETIFGNYELSKTMWTDLANTLYDIFAVPVQSLNELISGAFTSKWDILSAKITDTGIDIETFQDELIKTGLASGKVTQEAIDKAESFADILSGGWINNNVITETLKRMASGTSSVASSTEAATARFKELSGIVNKVIRGDYGNGYARVVALTKAGYDYDEVQNMVNKKVAGLTISVKDLSDAELKNLGYTKDQIKALKELAKEAEESGSDFNELLKTIEKPSGRDLFLESISNVFNYVQKIVAQIGNAWSEIFNPITSANIYNAIEAIYNFTKNLEITDKQANNLCRTFKGLFAALDIARTIAGGATRIAFRLLGSAFGILGDDVLETTANIGDLIVKFRNWLLYDNKLITSISDLGAKIATVLSPKLVKLKNLLFDTINNLLVKVNNFELKIPKFVYTIKAWALAIKNCAKELKTFIVSSEKFSNILNNFKSIGNYFKSIFDSIKNNFSGTSTAFNKFTEYLSKITPENLSINTLKDAFELFKNVAESMFEDVTNGLKKMKDNFQSNIGNIVNLIEKLKSSILGLGTDIKALLGEGDFTANLTSDENPLGNLLTIAAGAGVIITIKKLGTALTNLSKPLDILANINGTISAIGSSIKKVANAVAFNIKASSLIYIAGAIAILALSLSLLASQDAEALKLATKCIVAITIAMAVLVGVITLFSKAKVGSQSSLVIISLAASLLIIAYALKKLEGLKFADIKDTLIVFGIVLAELLACVFILGKFNGFDTFMDAAVILSLAAGLWIIADALVKLDKINPEKMLDNIAKLGLIFLELTIAARLAGAGEKSALTILAAAIGLKIMIKTLDDIAAISWEQLMEGLLKMTVVIGAFGLLMLATKLAGKNALSAGQGILSMAIAMIIIAGAIKLIGSIDEDTLKRGGKAVAQIYIIFGLVAALSKFSGENATKAGKMIILMAAGLLLISISAAVLAKIGQENPKGLKYAIIAIDTLILAMAALVYAAGKIDSGAYNSLVIIGAMIGEIAIVIGALAFLAKDNPEALISTCAGLSMVMLSLAGMMYIISRVPKDGKIDNDSLKGLLKLTGVIAVAGLVIVALAGLVHVMGTDPATLVATAGSISLILLAMAGVTFALSKVHFVPGQMGTAIEAMFALVGVLYVLSGVFAILALIQTKIGQVSIETISGISILLVVMTGITVVLSKFAPEAATAVAGVAALCLVITALSMFLIGIGALASKLDGAENFLDKGVVVLTKLGEAIGGFVGGILKGVLGGFMEGLASSLPAFADSLSSFAEKIKPFLESVKMVDNSTIESAKSLVELMLLFGAAELVTAITNSIFGEASIEDFTNKLVPFGEAMVSFSNTVSGNIDNESVTAAANAGKAIAEMAKALPRSGGLLQKLIGVKDLAQFAEDMGPLGTNLVEFSKNVSAKGNINKDAIEAAAAAATALAKMAQEIPNGGGLIAEWLGDNDMETFGNKLVPFGEALAGFSAKVSAKDAINVEDIKTAADAGIALAKMAQEIPNGGGLIAKWFGDNTMDTFGTQIESFGTSLTTFSDAVSDKVESINSSLTIFSSVNTMIDALPDKKDIKNIDTLGDNLEDFGKSLEKYSKSLDDVDLTNVATSVYLLKNMSTAAVEASKVDSTIIADFGNNFKKLGESGIASLVEGLESKKDEIKVSVLAAVKHASITIDTGSNMITSFRTNGHNLAQGLINGINDKMQAVYDAAYALGQKAVQGEKDGQDSASPSKATMKAGKWFGEGLIIGIQKMGNAVYNAGHEMGESAVNSISESISRISDIVDSDMETQPTIRPVLDLSDINSGVGTINDMFGMSPSLGILSNVGTINTMMNSRQNGDLFSAIADLGNKIGNVSGDTYNYNVNGVTYDDGSNVSNAVGELVRAARIGRRV